MKHSPQILIGVSAIFALVILAVFFIQTSPESPEQSPLGVGENATEPAPSSESSAPASNQEAVVTGPSSQTGAGEDASPNEEITIARIRHDGSTIIAGNAEPGSTINILRGGALIGTASVSDQGEWVVIPDVVLEPGTHLLTVEIVRPDGEQVVGDMALAVEILGGEETPLVALVPYTGEAGQSAKVLQAPDVRLEGEVASLGKQGVTIRSIQALSAASMTISGAAKGGDEVEIRIDDVAKASVKPDADSLYVAAFDIDPGAERIQLKAVLRDASGAALASASIGLSRAQIDEGLASDAALVVVQKGDALWRIAYKTYGEGIRYVDIVRQNADKIDDPDLIYPDQIFVIPNG